MKRNQDDWKEPDLTPFGATNAEKAIAANYIRIAPYGVEAWPDAHTVRLVVDQQSFAVGLVSDSPGQATVRCLSLAEALVRLVNIETKARKR